VVFWFLFPWGGILVAVLVCFKALRAGHVFSWHDAADRSLSPNAGRFFSDEIYSPPAPLRQRIFPIPSRFLLNLSGPGHWAK